MKVRRTSVSIRGLLEIRSMWGVRKNRFSGIVIDCNITASTWHIKQ